MRYVLCAMFNNTGDHLATLDYTPEHLRNRSLDEIAVVTDRNTDVDRTAFGGDNLNRV